MMEGAERGAWLARRAGKLTASRMADAMSYLKGGLPSAKRTGYMKELLAERIADANARHYVSPAMEHGILYESEALMAYEAATGNLVGDPRLVADLGVFDHERIENFAATPDGMLDDGGLIEAKCPTTGVFVDWVLAGKVPDEHKPQMIAQCACTGRRWVEFVAFDPRIKEESRRLFIRRFVPTPEEISHIESEAERFLAELENLFDMLVTAQHEAA